GRVLSLPARGPPQRPPALDLPRTPAEFAVPALAVREPHPEPFAMIDVGLRDLHRTFGEPEPPHAVGESRRTEPDLGDPQSIADLHQHVLIGHFQALEYKLAAAAVLLRPHDRNAPQNAPA